MLVGPDGGRNNWGVSGTIGGPDYPTDPRGNPTGQDPMAMIQALLGPMLAQQKAQGALARQEAQSSYGNQMGQYGLQQQGLGLEQTGLQEQYANEQFGWGQQQQALTFAEQQDPQRYALEQQGFQDALQQAALGYGQGTRRETAGSAASGSFATTGHAQTMSDLLKNYQLQQSGIGRAQQESTLAEQARQFGFGQSQAALTEAEKYGGQQYDLSRQKLGLQQKSIGLEEQQARNQLQQQLAQADLSGMNIGDLMSMMQQLMGQGAGR